MTIWISGGCPGEAAAPAYDHLTPSIRPLADPLADTWLGQMRTSPAQIPATQESGCKTRYGVRHARGRLA
jgi:hypothetical protein